ncbi:hypothetical protein RhiJN_18065 [Ceratobasidium sp. AG-Ba]|nr:hypothetical protein RhiJN_18065 [Ceratobasidium sp. AG-Ba]
MFSFLTLPVGLPPKALQFLMISACVYWFIAPFQSVLGVVLTLWLECVAVACETSLDEYVALCLISLLVLDFILAISRHSNFVLSSRKTPPLKNFSEQGYIAHNDSSTSVPPIVIEPRSIELDASQSSIEIEGVADKQPSQTSYIRRSILVCEAQDFSAPGKPQYNPSPLECVAKRASLEMQGSCPSVLDIDNKSQDNEGLDPKDSTMRHHRIEDTGTSKLSYLEPNVGEAEVPAAEQVVLTSNPEAIECVATNDPPALSFAPRSGIAPGCSKQVAVGVEQNTDCQYKFGSNRSSTFPSAIPASVLKVSTPPRGCSLPILKVNHDEDQGQAGGPSLVAKLGSLERGLFVGCRSLAGSAIKVTCLNILVVPGLDHNFKDKMFIETLFESFKDVTVSTKFESAPTVLQVQDAIRVLWLDSRPGSCLFIPLIGHGDDNNAMILADGGRIDEFKVDEIIQKLHKDHPKELLVAVAFDICRENASNPAGKIHHGSLVWSCLLGQKAYAFEFETFEGPSSIFLLGLLLAAHDTHQNLGEFEERFRTRVVELSRFHNHVRHVVGVRGKGACEICKRPDSFCSGAYTMQEEYKQAIDFTQSQDGIWNSICAFLMEQEDFREMATKTFDFIHTLEPFQRSNPTAPVRGASQAAYQTETTTT